MEAKKTVLALDWSNLLFRSLYLNQIYNTQATYDHIEDCRSFIYKLTSDICSIINIFKPDNIILLVDSPHTWRKTLHPDYKATRQHSETINWNNIFSTVAQLKNILSERGINIAEVATAEADDLAALCKEKIWSEFPNYNLIIVSADQDIRQLIDFNKDTNQYCAVYNTITKGQTGKRYFYVNQDFVSWLDEETDNFDAFFGEIDYAKHHINGILKNNPKIELSVEQPESIVVHKIFCGDDGDNIPAFYTWIHNGKPVRITPGKEKKITEQLCIKNKADVISAALSGKLKPVMESVCKKTIDDIDIEERLDEQRHMVELNSELFPAEIQSYKDSISYMLKKMVSKDKVFKAAELLKGTEFDGYDQKRAIEASVFKDIAKYNLTQLF